MTRSFFLLKYRFSFFLMSDAKKKVTGNAFVALSYYFAYFFVHVEFRHTL